jgi:hypothetical protein
MRMMAIAMLMAGAAFSLHTRAAETRPVGSPIAPPTTSPTTATAPAATSPTTKPRNLDKALEENVSFDLNNTRFEEAIAAIRQTTQTNVAVNWPALAATGITRDTPVTLRVADITYEQALRALIEQLPTTASRGNYLVGENALEITTNAELGKHPVMRIFPLAKLLGISATGKPADVTPEQRTAHAELLKKVIHMQLKHADEDPEREGRELVIRDELLVVSQSRRGLMVIQQTLSRFSAPVRLGQQPPGTQLSVAAKKAEQRMTELLGAGDNPQVLLDLAKNPAKVAPDLNVVLLPRTAALLDKAAAAPESSELDYLVNESGVVLIGPAGDVRSRVTLAVYDLKDLLKRLEFKSKAKPAPSPAELAENVLTQLQTKVSPGRYKGAAWGEMGKAPSSMVLYENLLVVSGSAAVHRGVAAGLQELYR